MKLRFESACIIGAALIIAAAGIADLIDRNTMIVLIVVLTCCTPSARRCSWSRKA